MTRLVQRGARKTYRFWENAGVHVTPVGFDSPIPSSDDLVPERFDRRYSCIGVDWNVDGQRATLHEVVVPHVGEHELPENPGLSRADAAVLYGMIRHHKPRRMVEAGSGWSTTFAAAACLRNAAEGSPCDYVAYDPYPGPRTRDGLDGLTALHPVRAQDVDPDELADCDLLFIDSSHVAAIGSDVNHLVLEVLPRLRPGTLVHFHDILLPGEYWREWLVERHHFWSEQYLVHALLLYNDTFRIRWAAHYMQLEHPEEVAAALPMFDPSRHRLSSLWLQRER